MTTAAIIKALKDDLTPSAVIAEMRAAVEELCEKLDGRSLGLKFRHFKRRNIGGRMIDVASAAHGSNRWTIVSAGSRRKPEDAPHSNHPTCHVPLRDDVTNHVPR